MLTSVQNYRAQDYNNMNSISNRKSFQILVRFSRYESSENINVYSILTVYMTIY